jgi:hypothetical protein
MHSRRKLRGSDPRNDFQNWRASRDREQMAGFGAEVGLPQVQQQAKTK